MILHKDIKPVSSDPDAGAHVVHYYTFVDTAAMLAGTDAVLGAVTFLAADVGRVARVGSAAPYQFFILQDHTAPTWTQIDGSSGAHKLAWEWNGTDTTQFAASPHGFRNDLGGGPYGAPTLSVVASPYPWHTSNVLRIQVPHTGTPDPGNPTLALAGGWFWRILDLPSPMPVNYIIDITFISAAINSGVTYGVFPFADITGGTNMNGVNVRRLVSSASTPIGTVVSNQHTTSSNQLCSSDSPSTANFNRGPDRFRLRVRRPNGENPAVWQLYGIESYASMQTGGQLSSSQGAIWQPAAWNSLVMDDVGFYCYNASSYVVYEAYISHFSIYEDDGRALM
jgi:hypothetical protein